MPNVRCAVRFGVDPRWAIQYVPRMTSTLSMLALALALFACGSDDSSHPYESQCTAKCTPSGVCASQDATPCIDACETVTDPASSTCASCIIDNTSWRETNGTGGSMCAGYGVGSASSTACTASCQ